MFTYTERDLPLEPTPPVPVVFMCVCGGGGGRIAGQGHMSEGLTSSHITRAPYILK